MGHYVLQPGDEAEKPTPEAAARDALTTLRGLAEDAADRMKEILDNAEIPDGMKVAVINMVLERVYGRPEGMDVSGTVQTEESEKFWFISDAHELEYVMKVFGDFYNLMEVYASRNPKDTLDGYKAAMFNRILEELKLTMPEHRILQGLETIAAPGEDGKGMTYSDALMLLTWYKNCLRG